MTISKHQYYHIVGFPLRGAKALACIDEIGSALELPGDHKVDVVDGDCQANLDS